jgi:hypothetical protein
MGRLAEVEAGAGIADPMPQRTMATRNTTATDETVSDLHRLDVKALTTKMTVYPEAPGVWLVQHNTEHHVSRVDGEFHCDCKGYQHGHGCYHVRRLLFELGQREVPAWTNEDAIDEQFREHVGPALADGGRLFSESRLPLETEQCDGGALVYRNEDDELGRELVGFSHPDGVEHIRWDKIRNELARLGLGVGAIHHKETYDPQEVGL